MGEKYPRTGRHRSAVLLLFGIWSAVWSLGVPGLRAQEPQRTSAGVSEAQQLSDQAERLEKAGQYGQAIELTQKALSLRQQSLGDKDVAVAGSLRQLADLYWRTGEGRKAEPLGRQALAIYEQALGPEHLEVARTLSKLARLDLERGDYGKAEILFKRALAIREKGLGPEHPDLATSLNNLASLYINQGKASEAELLFKRALAIWEKKLGPQAPNLASSLNNLAMLYENRGDHNEAEPLFRRALAIQEQVLGPEHPGVAVTLNNLAVVYREQGKDQAAEPLFKRALAIWEKGMGSAHPDVAASLNDQAILFRNRGDDNEAEPLFRRALEIAKSTLGPEHPLVAQILLEWTLLHVAADRLPAAIQSLSRGLDIQEANTALQLTVGSESRKRGYLASRQASLHTAVWLNLKIAPEDPAATSMAFTALLRRKGRVLDVLSNDLSALRGRLNAGDQQLGDELAETRRQLATLIFRGLGADSPGQYQDRLGTLTRQIDELEERLTERSSAFRLRRQNTPVTFEAVQKRIPPDAALVELVVYKPVNLRTSVVERFGAPRYAAYLLTDDGSLRAIDLGDAAPIDGLVRPLRQFLRNPRVPVALLHQTAHQLHRRLMQPILDRLPPGKRHLLISPDGALHLIPFAALVDKRNHYLAENFTISYLGSGRDLLRLASDRSASRQPPLILANPDYDGTGVEIARNPDSPTRAVPALRSVDLARLLPLPPLPGTGQEAQKLARLLPNARVLTGKQATENALKRSRSPRILHLATHGFFLDEVTISGQAPPSVVSENPLLRSGLALAGFDARRSGDEDGVLTALEVSSLDLQGTALVVLSACDTGLGQVQTGEGVYGLRRAFALAGAQSQLVSLWKVEDRATLHLMEEYYRGLKVGLGHSEALRQSQLKLLGEPGLKHPFYWAGFIPSGDWRSLPLTGTLTRR